MIDPSVEQIITIAEAKHHVPPVNGRKPDRSTIWRWTMRGSKSAAGGRVVLETINMPHGRATSVEAVERFFAAVSGNHPPAVTENANVVRKLTKQRLEAAGLL